MTQCHCFWTSVLPIVPASQPAYWWLESGVVFCVSTYTGFPFLTVTTIFPKPTVRIWEMISFSSSVSSGVFSVMFFTSSQQNKKAGCHNTSLHKKSVQHRRTDTSLIWGIRCWQIPLQDSGYSDLSAKMRLHSDPLARLFTSFLPAVSGKVLHFLFISKEL